MRKENRLSRSTYKLLPEKVRFAVRRIARESYLEEVNRYAIPSLAAEEIRKDSLLLFARKYKKSNEFKSVLSVLLTAVLVRLAKALIEDWIDKNLYKDVGLFYQEDEPGFLSRKTDKK